MEETVRIVQTKKFANGFLLQDKYVSTENEYVTNFRDRSVQTRPLDFVVFLLLSLIN